MFGWRRRNEGFEWREYVRTTILVRRADRQKRVEEAREAAIEKVKNARDIGLDVGKAGVSYAGEKATDAAGAVGAVLLALLQAIFEFLLRWGKFFGAILLDVLRAVAAPLVDAISAAASSIKAKTPEILSRVPIRWKHVGYAVAGLAVIYFGGPVLRSADGTAILSTSGSSPTFSSDMTETGALPERTKEEKSAEISGRARVIAPDLIRVDGVTVKLAGIEAPEAEQICTKSNGRRSKCAAAAKAALASMLRNRIISCTPSREDDTGVVIAQCDIDGTNINAELVRSGFAFSANDSFFGSLSSEEESARSGHAGLWQGEVERPSEWREKVWNDAKQDSPGGCPIKGTVRGSQKTYTMPWSANYKRARVRADRAERWFCSEEEAKAAGFSAYDRS